MHRRVMCWHRLVMISVLAGALTVGGCRDSGEGDYLTVAGKLFVFNYRIAQATYHLTLTKVRKVPDDAVLETTFENPAGGEPFIVRQNVWPAAEKIAVDSPPVKCVKVDREYKVTIRLMDAGGTLLQTINRTMISDTDESVLPNRPLVVGPFYDPNPDKDKPDSDAVACPA